MARCEIFRQTARGFSLIEILVALVLLFILFGGIMSGLSGGRQARVDNDHRLTGLLVGQHMLETLGGMDFFASELLPGAYVTIIPPDPDSALGLKFPLTVTTEITDIDDDSFDELYAYNGADPGADYKLIRVGVSWPVARAHGTDTESIELSTVKSPHSNSVPVPPESEG